MITKTSAKAVSRSKELRINEQKWTKTLMDAGWTAIPSVIFERQKAIGLDPLDINILLHISSHWWKAENKPHPSKVRIAKAIGVDPRTVQRRISAMEQAGFIRREERRISAKGSLPNIYHLDGLIDAALPYAKEKILEKKRRAEEDRKRSGRKRPILTPV
ncbi:MAG: helix-turn-helix domain-containing protein [Nitrospira sp.]|nr:helix-turn-helix domain-containing protein [Nitrospira sp.]